MCSSSTDKQKESNCYMYVHVHVHVKRGNNKFIKTLQRVMRLYNLIIILCCASSMTKSALITECWQPQKDHGDTFSEK